MAELNKVKQGDLISASQWNNILDTIIRLQKEKAFLQRIAPEDRKFGIITAHTAEDVAWKYTFNFIKKTELAYDGYEAINDSVSGTPTDYYAYNIAEYPLTSAYVPVPNNTIIEVVEFAAETGGTDMAWEYWFDYILPTGDADYQILEWTNTGGWAAGRLRAY